MKSHDLMFLPFILPLVGASLAFLAKGLGRHTHLKSFFDWVAASIGLILPLLSLFFLYPSVFDPDRGGFGGGLFFVIGSWSADIAIPYRLDSLAWVLHLLCFSVAIPAWVYTRGLSTGGHRTSGPGFTAILLILVASLSGAAMTEDIFNLFVCLEIGGIASYILVANPEKTESLRAAFTYLMISAAGMVFFLLGIYGLYRSTGHVSYGGMSVLLKGILSQGMPLPSLILISTVLILGGTAIRFALFPFQGWLPGAHANASHGVSAMLSGVLLKTPLFALVRFLSFMPSGSAIGLFLSWAGAFSAILGSLMALSQGEGKRLLAWSSVSQMGYVSASAGFALSMGLDSPAGRVALTVSLALAFVHALGKALLFLSLGTVVDVCGSGSLDVLRGTGKKLRKAGENFPLTVIGCCIALSSIMAIPPFNGFWTKHALSRAFGNVWQGWALSLAGVGTVACFSKLFLIFIPGVLTSRDKTPVEPIPAEPTPLNSIDSGAHGGLPWRWLAQAFLTILCLASIMPIRKTLAELSGAAVPWREVLKTLGIFLGGLGLFFLASTPWGRSLSNRIRNTGGGFTGIFIAFTLGLLGVLGLLGLLGMIRLI